MYRIQIKRYNVSRTVNSYCMYRQIKRYYMSTIVGLFIHIACTDRLKDTILLVGLFIHIACTDRLNDTKWVLIGLFIHIACTDRLKGTIWVLVGLFIHIACTEYRLKNTLWVLVGLFIHIVCTDRLKDTLWALVGLFIHIACTEYRLNDTIYVLVRLGEFLHFLNCSFLGIKELSIPRNDAQPYTWPIGYDYWKVKYLQFLQSRMITRKFWDRKTTFRRNLWLLKVQYAWDTAIVQCKKTHFT